MDAFIPKSIDSIAIAMTVDVSGSMDALDLAPAGTDFRNPSKKLEEWTRLSVVKRLFAEFVEKRPDDLIGLVSFGTYAATVAPLTMDHDMLLHALKGVQIPSTVFDAQGNEFATGSTFIVRDRSGLDTLSVDFKETVQQVIAEMDENNVTVKTFNYPLPEVNENGETVYNEDGSTNMIDTEITITRKPLEYAITCEQIVYMINRFDSPTDAHPFGTDGDGMDILARMMAGGRISLMVGFVVVLLETVLGVIMGGVAGFFGGWVDNLIMRLVDIFYCIPSMPILIILGALFDAMQMTPYARLFWLMAVLGFLGWAGIARLVRGQILSLREQDFMVAAEATGLPTGKRIFRHLIPNVMPQLIVSATMGLGSVILTESTLSFLGLGVKHPMATWGTMINSVAKSTETMTKYTYIWIPVGLLICLTVIAFNFVGDGLRDAFDPKMKR